MGGQRKTSSIVWRINGYIQGRKLVSCLLWNVFLGAVGIFCWCAAMESQYGPLEGKRLRQWQWAISENWWERMESLAYRFIPEGGTEEVLVNVGWFLSYLLPALGILLGIQLIDWGLDWMKHDRKLRQFMRPIDDAAMAAERIASRGIDERRIQNLEEAIDQITLSEDAVHIGDKDLMGLESAINNLLKRLQASYREQTRFVDDASHELRTPIAVIQGYASMLERWGMNDRTTLEESVHAIREESDHMKTLVDQLLFLARGDRGRQQLVLAPIDVTEMIKEVREESEMIDAAHRYVVQAEEGIRVFGDGALIKQAVRILVDNSVKYTPQGGTITLKLEVEENGMAGICVQDEGIGMEAEEAAHMFERFFRGEEARGTARGSGLGLSIAQWIIDRHEGRIDVLSYKGLGTRITIHLKRCPE